MKAFFAVLVRHHLLPHQKAKISCGVAQNWSASWIQVEDDTQQTRSSVVRQTGPFTNLELRTREP
eukprot:scaffold794_cov131-Cylindrotheca_fusiformis.AAC.4